MILLAGGSGRLGTLVVRRLEARGLAVRVLTRDRRRTAHFEHSQVEIVEGDVSVSDVAALVERALVDPSTRGATLEIGGPQNLSFNELAAALQRASKRTATARHVPRTILRLLAAVLRPVQPNRARQIRAAITMDSIDLTFMSTELHRRFPGLPVTSLADILAHH